MAFSLEHSHCLTQFSPPYIFFVTLLWSQFLEEFDKASFSHGLTPWRVSLPKIICMGGEWGCYVGKRSYKQQTQEMSTLS